MAEIVFGVGTSHSPLLAMKPEEWPLRRDDDMKNPAHPFRGKVYNFDELVELRKDENLPEQIKLEVVQERDAINQVRLDELGQRITDANLDVLVIFGDDQREVLLSDNNPAFMIFTGETVPFRRTSEERLGAMSEAIRRANWARVPDEDMLLKGAPELADHVTRSVVGEGFDVAVSDSFAIKPKAEDGIGHAFGFYYHRLLDDLRMVPSMRTLPIFQNTFFPPNQPTAARCLAFGRAVGKAIQSFGRDARIGVAASGGLSHFVIDEELDRKVLDAFKNQDVETLVSIPEDRYQSGTSEIKNWIAAMGALENTGLEFNLLDYVPCYRSEAGTGNAMAFALWH